MLSLLLTFTGCITIDPPNNPLAIDDDGDGYTEFDGDCDDSNPLVFPGAAENESESECLTDEDEDGWSAEIGDCDDGDASMPNQDWDCDGVETELDCDDNDDSKLIQTEDKDCDGVLTVDDCDDADPSSTAIVEDSDCDGVLTVNDCDDSDPSTVNDMDCDGILSADDCDDRDSNLLSVSNDMDCDGVLTADDCDDSDDGLLALSNDMDCDGVLSVDDCDDGDASMPNNDEDCDGVLSVDDCDDSNPLESNICVDVGGQSFEAVRLPAGVFTMGCTSEQGYDCESNENPSHEVTLSTDFYMMKSEVTQGVYQQVMGNNPSGFSGTNRMNRPVEQVSWYDAVEFANALSILHGLEECYTINGTSVNWSNITCTGWRLPTEAEWEYAARGGELFKYAGSDNVDDVAWYYNNSGTQTHDVCLKQGNGYGLCDMSGNVWEWVWDWEGSYSGSPIVDPMGPTSGSARVRRGGSWGDVDDNVRVSVRQVKHPTRTYNYHGFRLCRLTP